MREINVPRSATLAPWRAKGCALRPRAAGGLAAGRRAPWRRARLRPLPGPLASPAALSATFNLPAFVSHFASSSFLLPGGIVVGVLYLYLDDPLRHARARPVLRLPCRRHVAPWKCENTCPSTRKVHTVCNVYKFQKVICGHGHVPDCVMQFRSSCSCSSSTPMSLVSCLLC